MLSIVPHTVPCVGRSYEHFPDGFELHLLQIDGRGSQVGQTTAARSGLLRSDRTSFLDEIERWHRERRADLRKTQLVGSALQLASDRTKCKHLVDHWAGNGLVGAPEVEARTELAVLKRTEGLPLNGARDREESKLGVDGNGFWLRHVRGGGGDAHVGLLAGFRFAFA